MRILPNQFDNSYTGHLLGLWLFYLVTLVSLGRSIVHIVVPDGGAQSIATIPLDTFTSQGAQSVISIFGLWGLSQLLFACFFLLVATRYRSMIPLMYAFVLVEYLGRLCIGLIKPLATVSTPPGAIGNFVFIGIALAGIALTCWPSVSLDKD